MGQPQPPIIDPQQSRGWWKAMTSFISRCLRSIRARSDDWYRIQPTGRVSSNGGSGWTFLLLVAGAMFTCWLAYQIFMGIVELIRDIIQGICSCLIAAVPFVLLGLIGLCVVAWCGRSGRH